MDSPAARHESRSRILLVDDHPVTRQGVAALINQEPDIEVCGEADNAPAALDFICKHAPDLAVIDISLKTTNGIELVKSIRAVDRDVHVLIMSMHDEGLYAERALRAGAQGYIMKQEASANIVAAIRSVLEGKLYLSNRMKEKMLHRIVDVRNEGATSPIETLSDREVEVFGLIGNGFTTRQIAGRLNLSVKTIDTYREHLKAKLGIDTGAELVRHAIQWAKSEQLM